jgi:flagellar motor protein MotB
MKLDRFGAAFVFASALLASGCVSQQAHDQEVEARNFYQQAYLDLARAHEQLSAEVAELRTRPVADEPIVAVNEAAAPVDPDIDARMARLEELARRLGRTPGDVTTIEVEGGYGFALADSVVFDSGSAALRTEGESVLVSLAQDIGQRPFEALWVRGHTDNVPMRREATLAQFPLGNMQLSIMRALAVRELLVTKGNLPEDKLFVAGFGPHLPVADNATPEGQQRNRRVEIVVLEAQGAQQP